MFIYSRYIEKDRYEIHRRVRRHVDTGTIRCISIDPALLLTKTTTAARNSQEIVQSQTETSSIAVADSTAPVSLHPDPLVPLSKKMKIVQKYATSSNILTDEQLRAEIKSYLRFPSEQNEDGPLSFWKKFQSRFPLLKELAKDVLSQSASSVPVENMFSTVGLILNAKRSTLAPHRANWLSFIHDNFSMYNRVSE